MAGPDFLFAVRLSGSPPFDAVLGEVAANVFRSVGCSPPAVTELVAELNAVVVSNSKMNGGNGELDVQFRAHAHSCEVVVFARNREIWRTTRRLP